MSQEKFSNFDYDAKIKAGKLMQEMLVRNTYSVQEKPEKPSQNVLTSLKPIWPFIFWAIPIHELQSCPNKLDKSIKSWLNSLLFCKNQKFRFIRIPLNIILLLYMLFINTLFFKSFGQILYDILILGELKIGLLVNLKNFYNLLPLIIPLNFIWIFGYNLKYFLYDLILYQNTNLPFSYVKYGLFYFIIVIIKVIRSFLYTFYLYNMIEYPKKIHWVWYGYTKDVYLTLIIPFYLNLYDILWSHFNSINLYIEEMTKNFEISESKCIEILQNVKKSFKKLADLVLKFNRYFNLYFSLIIVYILIGIVADYIVIIIQIIIASLGNNEGHSSGKNNTFFDKYFDMMIQQLIPYVDHEENTETSTEPYDKNLGANNNTTEKPISLVMQYNPALIRKIFLGFFEILFKLGLLGLTVFQAIKVNDQAKLIHVYLNDFMSKCQGQFQNPKESNQVYQMYRSLKFYIHSKYEQPLPALANISILNLFGPIGARLMNYVRIRN